MSTQSHVHFRHMNYTAATTELFKLKGITFGALNIHKFDDIELFLLHSHLDLLAVNETWLNHSIADCEVNIEGYTHHRFYQDVGSRRTGGGGLITYFNSKYKFNSSDIWSLCCFDLKWTWAKLTLPRTRPTYVCNIDRPPSVTRDSDFLLFPFIRMPLNFTVKEYKRPAMYMDSEVHG